MNKLKHLFCIALAAVVTVTSFVMTPMEAKADGDTIITVPITVQEEYSMANEFFQLMNQKRAEAGLPEYKLDAGLMDMAMTRAAQLCIYFDHASLTSDPRKDDALGDLQNGTPIEQALRVVENIADGTGDATSTYNAWYGSNGHKLALISDKFYYCGIGAVTYHNNIKWCLIVSDTPCGNEIKSVSGSKTNTRNIDAKAKFFSQNIYWTINANANSSKCGADGYMNESFTFADIGTQSTSYYVTQPGVFTFRSNNPELFSVDGIGRIKPLKSGIGSLTVLYKGMELCTTPVKTTEKRVNPTPTPGKTDPVTPTPTKPVTPPSTSDTGNTEKPNQPSISTKLTVKVSNVTYNGKSQKPSVKVYSGKKQLSSKYYTVSYKNNKNVGYGTVTVKGKGSYSKASGTAKFKINLKKPIFSYTRSTKRKTFTIIWKKTGGNSGWQVQYSMNKKFRSGVRTINLKSSNTRLTVRNLKSRKNYYVRVRSYKKVGRQTWYSGWSNVKCIKIR
ncbi:CAP domain-containing protein [Blautia sp.]|uniref:CAP domain-containing protein n=1 Tax=Blautia sp. TaxID=1955243 RepID=UPI003AF78938